MKKFIAPVLVLSMALSTISPAQGTQAATKLSLSKNKVTMTVGTAKTVSANKKVKWKSSNKKIATVKKVTTKKAKISAKKAGSCKIIAIFGKKKATIRVTVKKKTTKPNPTINPTINPTVKPEVSVTPGNTSSTPAMTVIPTATPASGNTIGSPMPTAPSATDNTVSTTESPMPTVPSATDNTVSTTESPKPTVPSATDNTVNTTESPASTAPSATDDTISITESPVPTAPSATDDAVSTTESPKPTAEPGSPIPTVSVNPSATPAVATAVPTSEPSTVVSGSGVTMTSQGYAHGKLTYTLSNDSKDMILYTYDTFKLQKEAEGTWVNVEPVRNVPVRDGCEALQPGDSKVITENILASYDLSAGNYRYVKNIEYPNTNDKKGFELILPFEVTKLDADGIVTVSDAGISAIVEGYEGGKLTFVLTNNSEHKDDFEYGRNYIIQKKNDNGEWEAVEPDRYDDITTDLLPLELGYSRVWTEDIGAAYDLEPGNYRLVKTFFAVNCKCLVQLALPFEV